MKNLGRSFTMLVFALALGACISPGASAQTNSSDKATVTGCLQKGDEAGEYSITSEDGRTYGLRSKTVKLSQHLNHRVTVSGTIKPEAAEKEKKTGEAAEKGERSETGDIHVTDLKMVSDKCQ